jgi:hypothetical protein
MRLDIRGMSMMMRILPCLVLSFFLLGIPDSAKAGTKAADARKYFDL